MKLFFAYGNSDQASFRNQDVRDALDFMTVPGTIAAYYPDATAGFVLTSELDYIIDPRTPLFQGTIDVPRASHYSLAEWHGQGVQRHLGDPDSTSVSFDRSVYSDSVVAELVNSVIEAQRQYANRTSDISSRVDRYRRLLSEARGESGVSSAELESRNPSFVLAPYFAVGDFADPWWGVVENIWDHSSKDPAHDISPVVAPTRATTLDALLGQVPNGLANHAFYWVTGLDERRASESELVAVAQAVQSHSKRFSLVNLYGGFFSAVLSYVGLWGFSSGLGYSEARSWPELATTGAAPARYYVPRLHSFMAPAVAQLLVEADAWFACQCPVCLSGGIAALQYQDLKRHFAWSRRSEIETVQGTPPQTLALQLEETVQRISTDVAPLLPARLVPDVRYLTTWARVVRQLPS